MSSKRFQYHLIKKHSSFKFTTYSIILGRSIVNLSYYQDNPTMLGRKPTMSGKSRFVRGVSPLRCIYVLKTKYIKNISNILSIRILHHPEPLSSSGTPGTSCRSWQIIAEARATKQTLTLTTFHEILLVSLGILVIVSYNPYITG